VATRCSSSSARAPYGADAVTEPANKLLPESVRRAVVERLDGLCDEAQNVLGAGSMLGPSV
jgi:hypothetical protein